MRVLDIGAGTGILAIAAALLGASEVTAVEYDADAAETAQANIALNGAEAVIDLIRGDITKAALPAGAYDIVTANITRGLLERIAPLLAGLLAPGGSVIVSGLLDKDEAQAGAALEGAGIAVTAAQRRGEWLMLKGEAG
jgi:ribosomal protein L11 methyltransferase